MEPEIFGYVQYVCMYVCMGGERAIHIPICIYMIGLAVDERNYKV